MQRLTKVTSERDAVDIQEHRVLADVSRQLDRQGSCLTFRIFPPVADENSRSTAPPPDLVVRRPLRVTPARMARAIHARLSGRWGTVTEPLSGVSRLWRWSGFWRSGQFARGTRKNGSPSSECATSSRRPSRPFRRRAAAHAAAAAPATRPTMHSAAASPHSAASGEHDAVALVRDGGGRLQETQTGHAAATEAAPTHFKVSSTQRSRPVRALESPSTPSAFR